jgi:hypothetical protein
MAYSGKDLRFSQKPDPVVTVNDKMHDKGAIQTLTMISENPLCEKARVIVAIIKN